MATKNVTHQGDNLLSTELIKRGIGKLHETGVLQSGSKAVTHQGGDLLITISLKPNMEGFLSIGFLKQGIEKIP